MSSTLGLDPRFIQLRPDTLHRLHKHFDSDCDIRNASRLCLETLFCGKLMMDGVGFFMSRDAKTFYREKWTDWAKDVWRDLWCFGFCICTWRPHDTFHGIPRVLDLDQCDVYYYREIDNTIHFRVFRRLDRAFSLTAMLSPDGSEGDVDMKNREITDFEIFTIPEDLPDYHGGFNSLVHSLLPEAELYKTKLECSITADRLKSRPVVFIEQVPDKQSHELKDLPLSAAQYTAEATTNTVGAKTLTEMVERQKERVFGQLRLDDSNSLARAVNQFERAAQANRTAETKTGGFIYIDDGRKLVSGPLAEGPGDLAETRTAKTERTFAAFGIPLSMFSNTSSSNSMRKQTGQTGRGGGGINSSSQRIFQTFQQALKNQTLDMIKRMYNRIYLAHYANKVMEKQLASKRKEFEGKHGKQLQAIQEAKKRKKEKLDAFEDGPVNPAEDEYAEAERRLQEDWEHEVDLLDMGAVERASQLEVGIPGIPDDDTLTNLLTMGALKYEYFKKAQSERYSIPEEAFESSLEMTVKEMNGIVEKPEPAK